MRLILISFLLFCQLIVLGQNDDSSNILFHFIYTKSGNIYKAKETQSDSINYYFIDYNIGAITLAKTDLLKIEAVYKNSIIEARLSDHTLYKGFLINLDKDSIEITSEGHTVKLDFKMIASIEYKTLEFTTESTLDNPNATRYLFAPSAIPLRKGSGYYQNAYLVSNSANYGLTNYLSIGGGIVLPVLFYVTPKISASLFKNFYLGAGVIYTTSFLPDVKFGAGIPYGLLTYGNNENNITLGSGYGFIWVDGENEHTKYPITTLNGMKRLSRKLQLVTENWLVPFTYTQYQDYYDPLTGAYTYSTEIKSTEFVLAASLGLRILLSENSSLDFAPVFVHVIDNNLVLPYLDFVYKF